MKDRNSTGGGLGIAGVLTLIFIVLKLLDVIEWSWVWVLSPIWISISLGLVLIIVIYIVRCLIKRKNNDI